MKQKHFLGLGANPGGASTFHRIAYTQWGDPSDPCPVVCAHGLTRNSRDFDFLARALADQGRRVVCPDIVGRGRSEWASDPGIYGYPQYCADMVALIARLDVAAVDWVGTSMGGLIGMFLAGAADSPIRRLVMNDVGPFVPRAFMARMRDYVGLPARFRSIDMVDFALRRIHATFGPLTDAQWRHLAEHSAQPTDDGNLVLAYDPRIGDALRAAPEPQDIDLWAYWKMVRAPTLVIRGALSDLLSPDVVARMRQTHQARAVEEYVVDDAGHAPALMAEDQIARVISWLSTG